MIDDQRLSEITSRAEILRSPPALDSSISSNHVFDSDSKSKSSIRTFMLLIVLFSCILLGVRMSLTSRNSLKPTIPTDNYNNVNVLVNEIEKASESRRILSGETDLFTGDSTVTYNGIVATTSCLVGYYRPDSKIIVTGARTDGCLPCPRGTYGSTTNLKSALCTGLWYVYTIHAFVILTFNL